VNHLAAGKTYEAPDYTSDIFNAEMPLHGQNTGESSSLFPERQDKESHPFLMRPGQRWSSSFIYPIDEQYRWSCAFGFSDEEQEARDFVNFVTERELTNPRFVYSVYGRENTIVFDAGVADGKDVQFQCRLLEYYEYEQTGEHRWQRRLASRMKIQSVLDFFNAANIENTQQLCIQGLRADSLQQDDYPAPFESDQDQVVEI
jgi:hypothetical protein